MLMSIWNGLGFVLKTNHFNDSESTLFFESQYIYKRCTFRFKTFQYVFIHLEPCYRLHERSFSKINNRGTLIDGLELLPFCYHEETNSSTSQVAWVWVNFNFGSTISLLTLNFNEGTVNGWKKDFFWVNYTSVIMCRPVFWPVWKTL